MKTIDWTKPIRTVEGHRPARVICTDYRGGQGPIVIAFEVLCQGEALTSVALDGSLCGRPYVENIPEVPIERELWVNVAAHGFTETAGSKEHADALALSYSGRIARVRVRYHEGQFDE